MNKTLIIAVAAASIAAIPAFADDTSRVNDPNMQPQTKTEGQMNPTAATGAQPSQQPGAETSDRSPNKTTPVPENQVNKGPSGETSDRTPDNHKK